MVAKLKGEFVWHRHDNTDDFFFVLKGRVTIQMRSGNVTLGPGEMFVLTGAQEWSVSRGRRLLLSSYRDSTFNSRIENVC